MMNTVVRTRWAGAKNNGDFICVETYSGYRMRIRDFKGTQHLLNQNVADEKLGVAVLDALQHSRFVLAAPQIGGSYSSEIEFDPEINDYQKGIDEYAKWTSILMTRYGYKTKRALFKNMMSCNIAVRDGVMTIGPTHHEKLEGWGREKDDGIEDVVIPADSTPAEIGAALRLAFSRCTG